jgi:hypothetical protein
LPKHKRDAQPIKTVTPTAMGAALQSCTFLADFLGTPVGSISESCRQRPSRQR